MQIYRAKRNNGLAEELYRRTTTMKHKSLMLVVIACLAVTALAALAGGWHGGRGRLGRLGKLERTWRLSWPWMARARAGIYRGPIDGVLGDRTRYAIRVYDYRRTDELIRVFSRRWGSPEYSADCATVLARSALSKSRQGDEFPGRIAGGAGTKSKSDGVQRWDQ